MPLQQLKDFGLGKGAVGAGASEDAAFLRKLDGLSIEDFLVDVPALSASCIDERVDKDGKRLQLAKIAGGPLCLAYALRLSGIERYAAMDELQLVDLVMDTLEARGIAGDFAVHDDDHDGCGCGACAKAVDVDNEIADNFDILSGIIHELTGVAPSPVIRTAARDMDAGFFSDDRIEVLRQAQDDGAQIEDLVGDHDGQLIILNDTASTTVDSVALRAKGIRAFVVDYWVFASLAKIFAKNDDEQSLITQSLWLYNLATASVLCSSDIIIMINKNNSLRRD